MIPWSAGRISWSCFTISRTRMEKRGPEMSKPVEIFAALHDCKTILISVHKNPDGDALGSQLGLMMALEKEGKTVVAHNLDPVPEIYRFLPGAGRITSGPRVEGTFDAFV